MAVSDHLVIKVEKKDIVSSAFLPAKAVAYFLGIAVLVELVYFNTVRV